MTNWKNNHLILGEIKVGQKSIIIFQALQELPPIKNIAVSCGCTKPDYNKKTKEMVVSFKPKPIPHHLKEQGFYATTKTIIVTYNNGEEETLKFTAKIIQ